MTGYSWATAEVAWNTAQDLATGLPWYADHEPAIQREEESISEMFSDFHYSSHAGKELQSTKGFYLSRAVLLTDLAKSLKETGEWKDNPDAAKIIIDERTRCLEFAEKIQKFLDSAEASITSQTESVGKQIDNVINPPSVPEASQKQSTKTQSDYHPDPEVSESCSQPKPQSGLTQDDLEDGHLGAEDLAKRCHKSQSMIIRRTRESIKAAFGNGLTVLNDWKENGKHQGPVKVSMISSIHGQEYAVVDWIRGGKNKGWKYQVIKSSSGPASHPDKA